MHGVVREDADRATFDARERRNDAAAELGSQFEDGPRVDERFDDAANVVDAQPVFRYGRAQRGLVGAGPRLDRPLKIREIALCNLDRFESISDGDIDDAVRHLYRKRSDFFG